MRKRHKGTGSNMTAAGTVAILFVLTALAACACTKPHGLQLKDTEGRSFAATCKAAACTISSSGEASPSAPRPEGAEAAFVIHAASRLFAVCEVWVKDGAHTIQAADCRALTCKDDGDCPWAEEMTRGTCASGLCIEPSAEITNEDAVLLCLSGTGVPSGTNLQVERHALGNACGSPCTVPAVCRQP